jgi:plasmid stabilization system protein ParE
MSRRKKPLAIKVLLTDRALCDLREIERYSVKEWGRKQADTYLAAFESALDRLKENPSLLCQEPVFASGLHFYRIRKHFLVCDFRDHAILALTVIHTSMDIPTRLTELEPRLAAEAEFLHNKLRSDS